MIKIWKYNFEINVIIQNIGVWVALLIILGITFNSDVGFSLVLPLIAPVYLHLFFLERFYNRKKYLWYAVLTIAIIVLFGIIAEESAYSTGIRAGLSYLDDGSGGFSKGYISSFFINAGFNPFLAIVISTVYRYFRQKQIFQIQELREQKTRAELDLLRNQVNPHFLFNTLNTLFSMASIKEDEDTAKGISQLSELMRYMLYDAGVDKIKLKKEINHINNFIELQKLRFSDDDVLNIEFNITGEIEKYSTPPMLLIPFIENAFKHGFSVKHKSLIRIDLMIYDNYLNFKVYNTIHKKVKQKTEQSGIGIDNVQKRLELLFGADHTLEINESGGHFDVYLKMPISGGGRNQKLEIGN